MTLEELYNARIESGELTFDPAQSDVLKKLGELIDALQETQGGRKRFLGLFGSDEVPVTGLYIWGGVGRGKSMLMDMFFDCVEEVRKRRVHFHAFMQDVHSAIHEARKTGVEDAIEPVAEEISNDVRLLCFDEMQITDITDAMIVGRLFQKLFAAGVVIVATSNRIPDDLYKDGLNRDLFLPFIELLKDRMEVFELASPTDHRQNRLAGEQVYFHPANAAAEAELSRFWRELTHDAPAERLDFKVKGRTVTLPAFRNGIARATFFDLCGQPLGPGDYLEIASRVKVLLLENIPLLSRSNFNEAKRFVTLIDAIYEARVRLIASAADRPDRLYLEGEGVFEFARTASRLEEMQSADWP